MPYVLTALLFLIGVFGVATQRNIIKIIISVSILETAVNLFLALVGYRKAGIAPILTERASAVEFAGMSVDPFPQAMVLTSIVIGLSVIALLVAIALRIYHVYRTYDLDEIIKRVRGAGS